MPEERIEAIDNIRDEKKITVDFTIGCCPTDTYEQFIRFCKDNSTVIKKFLKEGKYEYKEDIWYAGGLRMLLDFARADAKNQMFFDRLAALELEVKDLQNGNTKKPRTTVDSSKY